MVKIPHNINRHNRAVGTGDETLHFVAAAMGLAGGLLGLIFISPVGAMLGSTFGLLFAWSIHRLLASRHGSRVDKKPAPEHDVKPNAALSKTDGAKGTIYSLNKARQDFLQARMKMHAGSEDKSPALPADGKSLGFTADIDNSEIDAAAVAEFKKLLLKNLEWTGPSVEQKQRFKNDEHLNKTSDDLIAVAKDNGNEYWVMESFLSGFPDPAEYLFFGFDANSNSFAAGRFEFWPKNWETGAPLTKYLGLG